MPDRTFREEELPRRLAWLVRLRWAFLVGLAATTALGSRFLSADFPTREALAVSGAILLYNAAFRFHHRRGSGRDPGAVNASRLEAHLQVYLDTIFLTVFIHLTGGIESPFPPFYLFHAVVAAILLSRLEAAIFGVAASGLFLSTIALEYFSRLPHHHMKALFLSPRHHNMHYIAVVALALVFILLATIYLASSIVHSLRVREKDLAQARSMLEKSTAELRRANEALVSQHTQLVQAEKLSSLGQIAAGIAHEVNNPIQFIHGNMQIIKEAITDIIPILDEHASTREDLTIARLTYPCFRSEITTLLADMCNGAVRIRDIVKDLKTFARRDEGGLNERVDLNEVARAGIRLLRGTTKRFQLVDELEPALPTITGNSNRLAQVIVNTLLNAVEALGNRSSGTIRMTSRSDHDGRQVRLAITDSGCGIPPEIMGKIFDPFFTTKQRTGGTGLGLSIAYGIMEQHGGRFEVESEVGKGSTFSLVLPIGRGV
jgi:signal transduction histidine kinase